MSKENMPLAETFDFSWDPENPQDSVQQLIAYARTIAMDAYNWYATEKIRKSRIAKQLRAIAIFLGGTGGIIPILSVIKTQGGPPLISPAWSTVAIGCAGVLVLFDRFFGLSSGWMRFANAMLNIRAKITGFDMDIAALKACGIQPAENDKTTAEIINRCQKLVADINGIILNESEMWKQEFTRQIRQLDEKIKKQEEEIKPDEKKVKKS